jgi:FdhD protein
MPGVDVILPPVSTIDAVRRATVVRVGPDGRATADDSVAVERALEVRIAGESFAVIMRTPGADRELAAGFLFSEGVVATKEALPAIDVRSAEDVVNIELGTEAARQLAARGETRRRVSMNASCGMCGRPSLASLNVPAAAVTADWSIEQAVLLSMPGSLAGRQRAFAETGGLHGAALATPAGDIVDAAEDVGRHNAVDKIVGRAFLAGQLPLSGHVLIVSGRTSFEIVQKAWLAGVPLVAAVSAPSSLAIELAEEAGITLIGFLRGERFNIYSHASRVRDGGAGSFSPRFGGLGPV